MLVQDLFKGHQGETKCAGFGAGLSGVIPRETRKELVKAARTPTKTSSREGWTEARDGHAPPGSFRKLSQTKVGSEAAPGSPSNQPASASLMSCVLGMGRACGRRGLNTD